MTGHPTEVETWLTEHHDRRAQIRALAELVHAADGELEEAMRWRRLTFTAGGDWHHWLCAVAATEKGVQLMFHKGALLDDPARLLRGESRYLRQVGHDRAVEHPREIAELVRQAVAHQTDMLD
ncbi:MAG: hypothetical protein GEV28_21095 [Actinophytocola sp.]|uniref:DUF1801 domain-containing protein n=1 Tax=Actinophytocola sp. TaxID=1872138 RepID=UPI0013208940|nr:DUF1801 domain-containing protein [Actinophytocola sp.]MPZ82759.1 hypothetical protein [Actinophytocola sp.]